MNAQEKVMNAQEKAMNAEQTTSQLDALANTHEVFNQATPLQDYNAFRGDTALYDAVLREGGERGVAGVRCLLEIVDVYV